MKVLVTGGGQVASALKSAQPAGVTLWVQDVDQLDITDAAAVQARVAELHPDVIINAAAYTAVDRAENERERAFAINAAGPAHLAQAARTAGAQLLHISTDFVFDGQAATPYAPDAPPHPLGVYGASKLEGERRVRESLGESAFILRTAWVYAAVGQNFVKTILRLCREKENFGVVYDQVGSPTWAGSIAQALWAAALRKAAGTQHWTDAGVASWYDFAVAIQEEALVRGLLPRAVPIRPIRTAEYPTPARRPAYSVLDTRSAQAALGVVPAHWRDNLRRMLDELKQQETSDG